jgi:hypothetical protein
MSGETAMNIEVNKTAQRKDAERENTCLTIPPRSGAEKPNRAASHRQEE